MQQTELRLSAADRKTADAVRTKGTCSAREVNRAHILLALDQHIAESQIMSVLGAGCWANDGVAHSRRVP